MTACVGRPTPNPNVVVVGITSGPNNLDPRFGINDSSQKIYQLIFDSLLILDGRLRVVTTGGLPERFDHPDSTTYIDYQYVGLNLLDPILRDVRVRQALAYAIDREAILEYLRRGLATPADGLLPPLSWAYELDVFSFSHDPDRARALLDEAGHPDPDGDGPHSRLRLTLKVSNIEFNRLQSTVIQQDLARVGVALEVHTYEFATLLADVVSSNLQLFTL